MLAALAENSDMPHSRTPASAMFPSFLYLHSKSWPAQYSLMRSLHRASILIFGLSESDRGYK